LLLNALRKGIIHENALPWLIRNKAEDDKRLRPVLARNQLENYAHWLLSDVRIL
jgi:hypothetical protein